MLEFLLDSGVSVDAADIGGWRALHMASEAGHMAAVQLLLRHNATVNVQTDCGLTPLHKAAQKNHVSTVKPGNNHFWLLFFSFLQA